LLGKCVVHTTTKRDQQKTGSTFFHFIFILFLREIFEIILKISSLMPAISFTQTKKNDFFFAELKKNRESFIQLSLPLIGLLK
jgi:hypothetical protein